METKMEELFHEIDPETADFYSQMAEESKRAMSLRLEAFSVLCLEKLAAHTGRTKTALAQDLLEAAAFDAVKHFGVTPTEEEFIAAYREREAVAA
jgi:hypothetical protein